MGPILGKLGEAFASLPPDALSSGEISILDVDIPLAMGAIEQLAMSMDDATFDRFIEVMFTAVRFDNKEYKDNMFDVVFTNNMMAFYKTIFFVLEVNYKDFFVKSGIGRAVKGNQPTISQKRRKKGLAKKS